MQTKVKMQNTLKPTLIWDFDGTIADTFTPTMSILRQEYERWGDEFHRRHTINQLRSLTITQIVRTIPGGWWKFIYLLYKAKKHLRQTAHQIKPYPGAIYTLRTLHDQDYPMYIVSSNNLETIAHFLHQYHLDDVFLDVITTGGFWRKAKTLRQLIRHEKIDQTNAYYLGDEIRDIQACHRLKLPIISVTYGYNSAEGLKKFTPTHMIKKPTQLLQLLPKLQRQKDSA
ncbi:HAD-IA family hydrolase [bacterium]|nr:HAD-IA family hydrolase [bacterium]MBQ6435987.1 HAD-IA family hydrolase [bacterium]